MNKESSVVEDLDRLRIKEERIIRSKLKKSVKKLERQKEQEEKELQLKIQSIGGNVNLISQEFADRVIRKNSASNSSVILRDEIGFPTHSKSNRISKGSAGNVHNFIKIGSSSDKQVLSLGDFIIDKPKKLTVSKSATAKLDLKYSGNALDSDAPVRKRGKFREVPKPKQCSVLRREINQDKAECAENLESQKLFLTDIFPNIIIKDEIDDVVRIYISRVVELQEKLFKRNSIKGKYNRRYVVGFHETKKHLNLNKVKVVVITTDIKFIKANDAMSCVIQETIELCKKNEVFYLFALKRRKLGILTLKHIPVSCIAILNHEGAEEQLNNLKVVAGILPREDENG